MKLPKQTPQRPNHVTDHSYDEETGALTVTFHNGKRYRYDGVDKDLAADFARTGSGSFLRRNIAPHCTYKCLDGNHDHD
jgi:hypothetical protein